MRKTVTVPVFIFMAAIIFCLFMLSGETATYYVDPSGNDSYSGLSSNCVDGNNGPFATPKKGMEILKSGDTLIINDGLYSLIDTDQIRLSALGTADQPILVKAANQYGAKISKPTATGNAATIQVGIWTSEGWSENNPFYLTLDGLDVSGGYDHALAITGSSYVTVKNCKLHDSGRDTIKVNSGSNYVVIENNELYNTGKRDNTNCEGIDVTSSDYITIRDNHIYNIPKWGLYIKKLSKFGVVERNIIHDAGYGISIGESTVAYDTIAKNNVLFNIDFACLQLAGAVRSGFYNNTCYNVARAGWAGIRIARAEQSVAEESKECEDVTFKNNIVLINNPTSYIIHATDPSLLNNNIDTLTLDDNLYFNLDPSRNLTVRYYSKNIVGIDAWKIYTQTTSPTGKLQDNNSVVTNPLFQSIDPGNAAFLKITASSLAVDHGEDLSGIGVLDDYFKTARPQGAGYDIGAYEYVPQSILSGDLNSDGKVDVTDVQACVNHILGAQDYGTKADVNSDGSVNVQDVQAIVNEILS